MKYILALDIGVASVGWAVIDKEAGIVVEACSNIFTEASAAGNQLRRTMRQGRRGKRRCSTRLSDFNKLWEKNGLSVPNFKSTDIVNLKVKALREEISLDELYLILYSYLKHRGISYLEDALDDSVSGSGAYANGLKKNAKELEDKYPCEIQKERLEKVGKYRGQTQIIDDNGEKVDLSNVFTIGAYRKEILQVFETQKKYHYELSDELCDEYILIFNRKRKYYEGPGNEKSRTDYGIFTTKLNEDGTYYTIPEKNIFAQLIGKCSVYPEELRAAAASYTAQEFNLLNDLNCLTINGRKLDENEKYIIVEKVKTSKSVNMRKIISNCIDEQIDDFRGVKIDKSGKENFANTFKIYKAIKTALEEIDVDINVFSRDELDEIGRILTINTDKEALVNALGDEKTKVSCSDEVVNCLVGLRKKNGALFSKWQSFSLRIMNELIPEMYMQPKEQMTLLTEMGVFGRKSSDFYGLKYIPVDAVSDEIYNPVVRRSVRIAFKILNAILRKYKTLDAVVIEMPRDRNSDEQKKRISESHKMNEKEMEFIEKKLAVTYGIKLSSENYSSQKQLALKLKLWNEQDGICLYSGRKIDPDDIIRKPELFQIDHIIPRSISYDDSRSNKVLVYSTENQKKGNQTPYFYMMHSNGSWTFEQFKATVMNLSKKKEYGISRKKVQNLLYSEDITKMEVLKGFINRNINDTRYASRVILNTLQSFFRANETETKVKVINGSYTNQMRRNMKLDKNREESYSHHAVDAMLIGFSEMGYEAYHKLQGEFIDFETGEILKKEMWDNNMSDKIYEDYLYGKKWADLRNEIIRAEKKVKYWHYVDKKCNRRLCIQSIRGTREYDGKKYIINSLDLRTKEGLKKFETLALSEKQSDKESLLVYLNDRRTFDNLVKIYHDYADADNPFVQYELETGDFVRKYSKKHNGPKINKLKYREKALGGCIDISHKYGHEKNSKRVVLERLAPYRMDVYYKEADKSYHLVGIKQSDIKFENGVNVIDEEAYARILENEKMIKHGQSREDLKQMGYIFKLSFYKNDIIEYEQDGNIKIALLSGKVEGRKNNIEINPLDRKKYEDTNDGRKKVTLTKTKRIRKYRTDILGNWYPCDEEKFTKFC